jgi:hypothetical protein
MRLRAQVVLMAERPLRNLQTNGFGAEYPHADELRDAFWGAIPEWRTWNKSETTKGFMEWFRFGLFMKAEWKPDDLNREDNEGYWKENISVEGVLGKYERIVKHPLLIAHPSSFMYLGCSSCEAACSPE